jgi:hypothetical protein
VLASLRVERRDDGSVHIVAPPETAATLVALLEGMARLVTAAAG